MIVANIVYKLSSFANYSMLSYNKNDVIKILESFDDSTLAPSTVQEILLDGSISQRMQFIAQNGLFIMQIQSGRIDISLTSNNRNGFTERDIPNIKEELIIAHGKLYSIFEDRASLANRLAWNTSYVYFDINNNERKSYKNKFLKELDFFKDTKLSDTLIRYAVQREVPIETNTEKINVLATITSYLSDPGTEIEVDGFRIDYDINTWQGNKVTRFGNSGIEAFVNYAIDIQYALNKEILP